ncbi:unnamed protein product, partial [Didymodactylos carnosus]
FFMDSEWKKAFAILYIKARYLISFHNAFQIIVDAFLKYCEQKLNPQGKLLFLRITTPMTQSEFRRAQSILYDLKYLLGIVPTQYTQGLREHFLNGFRSFLQLLSYMHGMDKVVRQVGQHIEFEPEWETGFNIFIKIQLIIQSILDWCSNDAELLKQAYLLTGETLSLIQQKTDVSHMLKKDALPIVKINEPLRIQVLSAQHAAGIWRRNGYSLSNQLYFYSNIKCRKEMYDRDILALQIGASLTPPDVYLIQLLYKFGLLEWVRSPENGRSTETDTKTYEKVRIMEEFLHLLLIIIVERYEPFVGQVTKEEKLKREVLHQLCTAPMTHSDLVRNFTDSGQELETVALEIVLKEIADFKKLSQSSRGNYELKNDCLKYYNPFYYHYTKADQCKSEEYVLKRRKALGLSSLLLIPSLPSFCDSFQSVIQLLQCDIFLTLVTAVLYRTIDQKAELWSEAILIRILHLICLALFEQEDSVGKQQTTSTAMPSEKFQFYENSQKYKIEKLLVQITTATKADACEALVSHVLKLFSKYNEEENTKNEQSMSSTVSQDLSNDTNKEKQNGNRRKELIAQKQAKIMAKMTALQRVFIKENKDLFPEEKLSMENDSLSPTTPSSSSTTTHDLLTSELDTTANQMDTSPCQISQPYLGTIYLDSSVQTKQTLTCIFCQENSELKLNSDTIVISAYVQSSRVLSKNRSQKIENPDTFDPTFMSNDLYWGVHVSSCGHPIHASCWMKYHDSVLLQSQRLALRTRGATNYDIEMGEFLCPLCQTLSNTVIPLLPSLRTFTNETKSFGLNVNADDRNDRVPTILWTSCAYTIQTIENLLRIDSKSILKSLSLGQTELISSLVKVSAVYGLLHNIDKAKIHCLKLLSVLLPSPARLQVPSLANVDLFHLLVSLCFTLPILFIDGVPQFIHVANGNLNDLYLMRLILTAHCLQILSSHNFIYEQEQNISEFSSSNINNDDDGNSVEVEAIKNVVQKIIQSQKNQSYQTPSQRLLSGRALCEKLKLALLPLLRCSALFYHHLTDTAWPTVTSDTASFDPSTEYTIICQYLGLPKCLSKILNQNDHNNLNDLLNSLTSLSVAPLHNQTNPVSILTYPIKTNELYHLPKEYIDVMNQVSQYAAPYTYARDETRSPCICLICGEIVVRKSQTSIFSSLLTSYQESKLGTCYLHTLQCCGPVGLYLRIKECSLLLIHITDNGRANKARGTLIPAPYIDDYGETDQGLRRGNPLHLCEERYRLLYKRWLSHTFTEDISRSMELNTSIYATIWNLF